MDRTVLEGAPPPHVAHARLARRYATTFLLESREGPERLARHSFVGFDPAGTVRCTPDGLHVTGALPDPAGDAPLDYLRRLQALHATAPDDRDPFVGGLVGSLGHGFTRLVEPNLEDGTPEGWPRFRFGLYLDALVYDHVAGTCTYVHRSDDRSTELRHALASDAPDALDRPLRIGAVHAATDRGRFEAQVRRAQDLIRQGECFQIVLSRAYTADHEGPLLRIYDALRDQAPVPYLYHLRDDGTDLLGASPEMLVRVRRGTCETYPIAGTRPLTGDAATDAAAGEELRHDPKETAEHAMLVDLARNDLSRVCIPGSVHVPAYQDLLAFRTVQHLVSRVQGTLAPGRDALDALAAVFPAGTVSGAPKLRALEHIATIEDTDRGPYAGAVTYLSFHGDLDSAITIRSLSAADGHLTVQAGAGITVRSDPTAEFHETRHKAGTILGVLAALGADLPDEGAQEAP